MDKTGSTNWIAKANICLQVYNSLRYRGFFFTFLSSSSSGLFQALFAEVSSTDMPRLFSSAVLLSVQWSSSPLSNVRTVSTSTTMMMK